MAEFSIQVTCDWDHFLQGVTLIGPNIVEDTMAIISKLKVAPSENKVIVDSIPQLSNEEEKD